MRVFEPLVSHGFEWINCENADDYEAFLELDGTSCISSWSPVRVRCVPADAQSGCRRSDFPWLGSHVLVLRNRGVQALQDVLEPHGELLPLIDVAGSSLHAFNAFSVDALEESRSSVTRFSDTGAIMFIHKLSLIQSRIRDLHVFRLPHRASSTYVSEEFVRRVGETGLEGLEFNEVWSSR